MKMMNEPWLRVSVQRSVGREAIETYLSKLDFGHNSPLLKPRATPFGSRHLLSLHNSWTLRSDSERGSQDLQAGTRACVHTLYVIILSTNCIDQQYDIFLVT